MNKRDKRIQLHTIISAQHKELVESRRIIADLVDRLAEQITLNHLLMEKLELNAVICNPDPGTWKRTWATTKGVR
jgi:hypothetical protein